MANRIISGELRDQKGRPLVGAQVSAWDSDTDFPGDNDDFMGDTISGANGCFQITYKGGEWDTRLPGSTSFRPDIYLKVKIRSVFTQKWVKVWQSKVYSNWIQANPLNISETITIAEPESRTIGGFDPQKHGFRFANSFMLTPDAMGLDLPSYKMGFCGGMSAAARNYFKRGVIAPADTVTPADGTPLFEELFRRQKATLGGMVIPNILVWQASPDEPHPPLAPHSVGFRTKKEWPLLKEMIDAGEPMILVLIREEGAANPTNNHQVLAFGYDWNPMTKDLKVTPDSVTLHT